MDVRETMKQSLSMSKGWADSLLKDISEQDSMVRGQDNLNHIKWLTGHLCVSSRMLAVGLGSDQEFSEKEIYSKLFDWNTSPSSDSQDYPPLEEIRANYDRFHEAAINAIVKLSDADFEKEIQMTEDWKSKAGEMVVGFAQHQAYHVGQMADVRSKVLGRKGLFG